MTERPADRFIIRDSKKAAHTLRELGYPPEIIALVERNLTSDEEEE